MTIDERESIYYILNEVRRVLGHHKVSHRVMNPLAMAERTMRILVFGEHDPTRMWWKNRVTLDIVGTPFVDAVLWAYKELMSVYRRLVSRDAVSYGEQLASGDVRKSIQSLTQLYDSEGSWLRG